MITDAMVTATIIELLEHGLVAHTIQELTKAVSNMLGTKVTTRRVTSALNRNRHRITFQSGQLELIIKF